MKLLKCPDWTNDEDSKLPGIAQAASAFKRFIERQNPKSYILTHGDLKEWHRRLFEKAATVDYFAGNYRSDDNSRPCLKIDVGVGGIPGAPFAHVETLMKKFSAELERATKSTDAYLSSPRTPAERIRVAAQLSAFVGGTIIKIHPFVNGNGRMARMAMDFFLHRYLGIVPFYIDRPKNPNYSIASMHAMRDGVYLPMYQYLVETIAENL